MFDDVIKRFNEHCNKTPCNVCEMENDIRQEYACYHQGFYMKGYEQGAREFAEWCLKHNIDFSNCKDSDCDKCTRTICRNTKTYVDVALAEWQKGAENELSI